MPKKYTGPEITVLFEPGRCVHAAECVRGLSAVFNPQDRPWVKADQATASEIATVVQRCPSGALHYEAADPSLSEVPDASNTVMPRARGPLYVRGRVEIEDSNGGAIVSDTRVTLCRCGGSNRKPFCDGSHRSAEWSGSDPSKIFAQPSSEAAEENPAGPLHVRVTEKGPLALKGSLTICDSEGQAAYRGETAYLCRCGASGKKPFCDGTHGAIWK